VLGRSTRSASLLLRSGGRSTMQCARGQALRQLNYPRAAKAYEKDDIPTHVRAGRRQP
jgi:hypothetical protein